MVKRKDFNATLKQLTDGLERMCSGNRFHSDRAATANERAPNFVAVLGMTRSSRAADRSLRLSLASMEDTGRHMLNVVFARRRVP